MSLEQTIGNLEIRYANVVTFVGSSNTMVDTTTGRIQTKGFQHNSNVITDVSGPHGRLPTTQPIVEHPIMHIDQTAERPYLWTLNNGNSSNISVKAGYTVTASTVYNSGVSNFDVFRLYDGHPDGNDGIYYCSGGTAGNGTSYSSTSGLYRDTTTSGGYSAYGGTAITTTVSGVSKAGEWLGIETPHPIVLKHITLFANGTAVYSHGTPHKGVFAGSHDGVTWESISTFNDFMAGTSTRNVTANPLGPHRLDVNSTTAYKYHRMIVEAIQSTYGNANGGAYLIVDELRWYGCNDNPPAGDHSVDTTFKSRFNNPQLTGVQVLVDGGMANPGTNQISGGADPSGNQVTMTSPNKYWTLNGTLTSNLSVEANTFLEGDQPHAVSVWFNSSNLEANVSNTCVFSIASEEKLDSVNLDLQSNTWHNLTYAYQGEGGSRVAYLDGRKVAEDQAEDTFGDYPPFAMTGYSQGGYVVSAVEEYDQSYQAWEAFDNDTNTVSGTAYWSSKAGAYNTGASYATARSGGAFVTSVSGINRTGVWLQLELPHKLKVSYITWQPRASNGMPRAGFVAGSNNGTTWEQIYEFAGVTGTTGQQNPIPASGSISQIAYKYIRIIPTNLNGNQYVSAQNVSIYGHRENDLVRLPDPTNVLKYPHVVMTGPAQRGYVATASSTYTTDYQAWKMFADDAASNPSPYGGYGWWLSAQSKYRQSGDNDYLGGTADNLGTYTGSSTATDNGVWVQLKMPHKILLSSVFLGNGAWHETAPGSFKFYGTNNDQDWTLIKTFTGQNPQAGSSFAINATVAYRTIGLVITHTAGTNSYGSTGISEMELYGTGVDSIPIQIGGGNIDRVANFRVYDKFIEEDQVNEIWNAQKEEFGRAKPQMVLQQGKLGIGTDAPQGSLSVADEPHNLEEFPPRGIPSTGPITPENSKVNIDGHGTYEVLYSVDQPSHHNNATDNPLVLFDKTFNNLYSGINTFALNSAGATGSAVGSGNPLADPAIYTGNSSGRRSLGGYEGIWYGLKFPFKVNLSQAHIQSPANPTVTPNTAIFLGSEDGGLTWSKIGEFSGASWVAYNYNKYTLSHTKPINAAAIVITHSNHYYAANMAELKFFGTREQGQSVLHDGQLTLTKSLNVPRIGPALDADDTPRRDRLVVEYNTSTNPTFEGAVRDTSGRGNDGVFYGTAAYNAGIKAFDGFSSVNYIRTDLSVFRGNVPHSHSVWIKLTSDNNNWNTAINLGQNNTSNQSAVTWEIGNNRLWLNTYSGGVYVALAPDIGKWYHVVATHDGTGAPSNSRMKIYVDGVKQTTVDTGNGAGGSINIAGDYLTIGAGRTSSGAVGNVFNGGISTYKLYDTVLTPEEVKTLYDMGRCDEGHHVVNFSKTRVGIGLGDGEAPTYTLDVRGLIRSQGSLVTSFTGQHKCIPEEPMEKGLIVSAKKNQFVKLNGLATGKSAITIDESLPIVSLSNVAQDKACFGVVSSTEEANTTFRVETTNGGVISTIPKTLGDNRAIVNSVGEGAIWVVDTRGSLESGDYITTSNLAGYGQKQDDDVLHNFTVAKITMDCDFTGSNVAVQTIKREQTGTRIITEDAWNQLVEYDRYSNVEDEITTYYQIQRGGNVLDESGQLQFEDKTGATEEPYERRFLTTDGTRTDEANAVHIAAFVGCTYHCG